ncbi:DUF3466 family protein [Vibrio sinus]
MFKRTAIAASLLAVTQAHAALYRVYEPTINSSIISNGQYTEAMGVAIEPSSYPSNSLGCFAGSATCSTDANLDQYKLAIQTLMYEDDGARYREEVPFAMDNAFQYIQSNSDYVSYCTTELGYNSDYCQAWANIRYDKVWAPEQSGAAQSSPTDYINAKVYVEGDSTNYNDNGNTVVNSLQGTNPIGNKSDYTQGVTKRNVAFNGSTSYSFSGLLSPTPDQSRAFYADGTYVAGSTSYQSNNDNGTYSYSKATIWDGSDAVAIPYDGGSTLSDNKFGEGSIRSFYRDTTNNKIYAVGYNTYANQYMDATIFTGSTDDITTASWTSTPVQDAQVDAGGSFTYSNSVLTGVNQNLVAIGNAKRSGSKPYDGAAANRMFLVSNVSANSPTASFFSGGIFFDGAGGRANAINNFDEIVGEVDAENVSEIGGTPRRQRAFIYPYAGTNSNAARRDIFDNKAWWLDDLTNGGTYSSANNAFRIIDATGINDQGIISATAIKCSASGGYSSTNDYATCNGSESTVAVKLIPIAGATKADIDPRDKSYPKTERKGGSVGWLGLSVLALIGLQRRRRT